jgi:hypothetical protein
MKLLLSAPPEGAHFLCFVRVSARSVDKLIARRSPLALPSLGMTPQLGMDILGLEWSEAPGMTTVACFTLW